MRRNTEVGSTRRKFTAEYKAEAVELVINSGRPIAEIARDLGINEGTLGNWVKTAKKRGDIKESRWTSTSGRGSRNLRKKTAV
jgi:transposase